MPTDAHEPTDPNRPAVAAVVLAGGSGARLAADVNKVYLSVDGRRIAEYSIETLGRAPGIAMMVLVVRDEDRDVADQLIAEMDLGRPALVVTGGAARHDSEYAALGALRPHIDAGRIDVVAIHDGARPFVTRSLLDAVVAAARIDGGGVPGLDLAEPLYRREGDGLESLPQSELRRVQTPQAFRAAPLLAAFDAAAESGFRGVDTAETVGRFSDLAVRIVAGDPRNIKVTYAEDLPTAAQHARQWSPNGWID